MTVTATLTLLNTEHDVGNLPARLDITVADQTTGPFAIAPVEPLAGPFGAPYLVDYTALEPGQYTVECAVQLLGPNVPESPTVSVVTRD